ncbi:MAG: SDR family NAD(P)-dependent oxidoreductase [bacterium]|nr:MAG: SDR family NAD(P)-dependent oxidoreductase [bacterium]
MNKTAIMVGNSSGMGLAITRELLKSEWRIVGISRSTSPVENPDYRHIVADVRQDEYQKQLKIALKQKPQIDLCIYFAGIGELLDLSHMEIEPEIFEVNLLGLVKTVSLVIPAMVKSGQGHFVGISSFADELVSAEAPSYHGSKAGLSNYLEGLALALKPQGIAVTNVRFGFVDTKMAKGEVKPFMMSVDRAVKHLLVCLEKKPVRYTAPGLAIPLVKFRRWMMRLRYLSWLITF